MKKIVESWRGLLNEEEPYQRRQRLKHPRVKKDLIGCGGNTTEAGPFSEDPKMKRNKSAPPGFGAVGEVKDEIEEGRFGPYDQANYQRFIEKIIKPNNRKVRRWAGLKGRVKLLGKGTQGIAYRVGDQVIKYTIDADEANSAAGIKNFEHPNLYNIRKVGELKDTTYKTDAYGEHERVYVIIYDYLDPPNELMEEVADQYVDFQPGIMYKWPGEQIMYEVFDYLVDWRSRGDRLRDFLYDYDDDEIGRRFNYDLHDLVWMVVYSMPNANMEAVEDQINEGTFTDNDVVKTIIKYMSGLGEGLTALKKNGITYSDMWSRNVMQRNGEIVIIDIGYSQSAMTDIEVITEKKNER